MQYIAQDKLPFHSDDWSRLRARLIRWDVVPVRALLPALAFESNRHIPPEAILEADETEDFNQIRQESLSWRPSHGEGRRLVAILKLTRLCNLRCRYCHSWRDGPGQVMEFATAARAIASILRYYNADQIDFVWHGGEVTTLPVDFARKILWLQAQFAHDDQIVRNSVQTNAFRISDDWIHLIAESGLSVGVSIDGTPDIHDHNRRTIGGKPTFERVVANMARMSEMGISVGALVVVTSYTIALGAEALLQSLVRSGVSQIALLNEIPDINSETLTPGHNFVPFAVFVEFMREISKIWWSHYRTQIRVRELDAYLAALDGLSPRTCTIAGNCMGGYLTIDPDGAVAACDKYVGSKSYVFGKLSRATTEGLPNSPTLHAAREEANVDTNSMLACPYFRFCKGGCPHDNKLTRAYKGTYQRCCGLRPLFEDLQTLQRSEKNGGD
jgi:uncharacterized protein